MRIAIIYDCLYPHSVGGAERWYLRLAEHLGRRHRVTYLTRRQWDGRSPSTNGFEIVAVSPDEPLYTAAGKRRFLHPIRFGLGVFRHLIRRGADYDVIDCAHFPYFSLLAAWLALKLRRSDAVLVADWHECWTRDYWIEYAGPLAGRFGYMIQWLCVRATHHAITFSRFVTDHLRAAGFVGEIARLPGLYDGPTGTVTAADAGSPPTVVYAGRHIPDKRVTAIPAAIAAARRQVPDLRCTIFGDGPERGRVMALVRALGLERVIDCPGFAASERVEQAVENALCLILPSRREGYGLVVVEAAAHGTPVVVTESSESAATELVAGAINGYTTPSASPDDLAQAIACVSKDGFALREKTAAWFNDNSQWLAMDASVMRAEETFARIAEAS